MNVVLDTHVLLWWTIAPGQLSRPAASAIARAERLMVSALSFWEMSMLVRRKRVHLGVSLHEWVSAVRDQPRIDVASLGVDIALLADALPLHGDPADRFIVATARSLGAPLVTKDRNIRKAGVVETLW